MKMRLALHLGDDVALDWIIAYAPSLIGGVLIGISAIGLLHSHAELPV